MSYLETPDGTRLRLCDRGSGARPSVLVLERLELEDATLVGWSMGCTVSLRHLEHGRRASPGSCS